MRPSDGFGPAVWGFARLGARPATAPPPPEPPRLSLPALTSEAAPELERTYFDVLGVHSDASAADIRRGYRRSALLAHPDKGGSRDEFQQVLRAFEVLSGDESRRLYQQQLRAASSASPRPAPGAFGGSAAAPPTVASRQQENAERLAGRARAARLERALLRLERALATLPREARRAALEGLPVLVRTELLQHMDAHRSRTRDCSTTQSPSSPSFYSGSDVGESRPAQAPTGEEPAGASPPSPPPSGPELGSCPVAVHKGIMRSSCKACSYYATVMVQMIVVNTRPDPCLEVIIKFHTALTRAKQKMATKPNDQELPVEDAFPEALQTVCAELNLDPQDLELSYAACISGARAYVGSTVSGRSCTRPCEAVAQRDRMLAALAEGWESFRLAYAACKVETVSSKRVCKTKTLAEALGILDAAFERFRPHREAVQARLKRQAERRAESERLSLAAGLVREEARSARMEAMARRGEARVQRAVRVLERILRPPLRPVKKHPPPRSGAAASATRRQREEGAVATSGGCHLRNASRARARGASKGANSGSSTAKRRGGGQRVAAKASRRFGAMSSTSARPSHRTSQATKQVAATAPRSVALK
eukprot:TRINITY_DN6016_c2_g1_i1.p1 TRINITY_DN6016_c2_g1~~TRINITY_DN6016_c2_g1_i1.p1  ORF type:complete len:597 (+),score=126.65 TRINITY_DN6016_c2_g1_i1:298-2088(+)